MRVVFDANVFISALISSRGALAGDAKYIISGDAHLQAIGQYQGIQLLSPVEFLAQLESDML